MSNRIISISFGEKHQDLLIWLKEHCDEQDYSLSYLIRKLLRAFKERGNN